MHVPILYAKKMKFPILEILWWTQNLPAWSLFYFVLECSMHLNWYLQKIRTRWVKVSFHSVLQSHFFYNGRNWNESFWYLIWKCFLPFRYHPALFISELWQKLKDRHYKICKWLFFATSIFALIRKIGFWSVWAPKLSKVSSLQRVEWAKADRQKHTSESLVLFRTEMTFPCWVDKNLQKKPCQSKINK